MKLSTFLPHLGVAAIVMLVGAFAAVHQGQDMGWDILNYHYYNPWSFLHNRLHFDYAPAGGGTYANPILDVFDYALRSAFSPIVASAIIGAVQGLNGLVVFEIALLLLTQWLPKFRYRYGVAAGLGVLSLTGSAAWGQMGASNGDTILSLFILAALFGLLKAYSYKDSNHAARYWRITAYGLAGVAVGLKLTAMIFVLPLLTAGILIEGDWRHKIRATIENACMVAVGVIAVAGFWYVKMWALFHNPVFPYYNGVFRSPYAPLVNMFDERWVPHTIKEFVSWPFIIAHLQNRVAEPLFRDPRLAGLVVLFVAVTTLLCLGLVLHRKTLDMRITKSEQAFWVLSIGSLGLWIYNFGYYRYVVPLEILSITAVAVLLYRLFKPAWLATAALCIYCIAAVAFTVPMNFGRIPWQQETFGPGLSKQLSVVENGIVLMPVSSPYGFLVPYLPENTRAINILGYGAGSDLQRKPISDAIRDAQIRNKQFYGLMTNESIQTYPTVFSDVGYKLSSCRRLETWLTQYVSQGKTWYNICKLSPV